MTAAAIKRKILALVRLNNTPHEIAFGTAIGVFIGITPLYGFHTILVILLAMLIPRANRIAILSGSNISIPPTAPFISWAGYEIGRFILKEDYPAIIPASLKGITYKEIESILFPLFAGSFVLGLIGSFICYFAVLVIIKKIRKA